MTTTGSYTARASLHGTLETSGVDQAARLMLMAGLVAMPFMFVRISILQPAHVWMIAAAAMMLMRRGIRVTAVEMLTYGAFLYFGLALTLLQDFDRIKAVDQIVKFAIFYPGFYLVGRWFGWTFRDRPLPLGETFLFAFLAFQYLVQALQLPLIYEEIGFGQGALHGTFLERNWLAFYFFLLSYVVLLKSASPNRFISFFAINGLVVLLSGSKTTFIACGIIFLMRSKLPLILKLFPLAIGALFYLTVLGDQFTPEKLAVKTEEERGLALTASLDLIAANPIGYGWGFVEAYFASSSQEIRGLGGGANSVFAVPLVLWIIAGGAGLVMWVVFFTGLGNGAISTMLPLAPLSLLNPLHQSELVYFFIGVLVSLAHWERAQRRYVTGKSSSRPAMLAGDGGAGMKAQSPRYPA